MKCPHCNYEKGWNSEELEEVNQFGEDFIRLLCVTTVNLEDPRSQTNIYACPKCRIVFINNW